MSSLSEGRREVGKKQQAYIALRLLCLTRDGLSRGSSARLGHGDARLYRAQ